MGCSIGITCGDLSGKIHPVDLAVHDLCTFNIYGVLLQSESSYKSKSSTDRRFHYKAGQLKTTAAEKLKGVIK